MKFDPGRTFDTFVGGNNSFALATAHAVAQAPGKSYNPLFLYGGVGLGKTHLLHAIGQYVAAQKERLRVEFVSSESLTIEFIDCVLKNRFASFRKKYRQTDVLLIDDIQHLGDKERMQEEFFHTFNALFEEQKQIVLTCDRPTSAIENLERRLVSRFEGGLVADLQPPDIETRLAILRKKSQSIGMEVPEEIMELLANRIQSNVRRLQGALIRVAVYAALTGKRLNREMAEGLLQKLFDEEERPTIAIEDIQKKVAEHFDIGVADLASRQRPEGIAFPRQVAMYLSRQMTDSSLSAIGYAFGGRNHGTVLHACQLVKDRMEVDPSVRQIICSLERQLIR